MDQVLIRKLINELRERGFKIGEVYEHDDGDSISLVDEVTGIEFYGYDEPVDTYVCHADHACEYQVLLKEREND